VQTERADWFPKNKIHKSTGRGKKREGDPDLRKFKRPSLLNKVKGEKLKKLRRSFKNHWRGVALAHGWVY